MRVRRDCLILCGITCILLNAGVISATEDTEDESVDYHCLSGDFNNDGKLDDKDMDGITGVILSGEYDKCYDLNGDCVVDAEDGEIWVDDIKNTMPGDANLDGQFDSADLILLFATGHYEDDIKGNSGWAKGDFNNDGEFDSADLIAAFGAGHYENGPLVDAALLLFAF